MNEPLVSRSEIEAMQARLAERIREEGHSPEPEQPLANGQAAGWLVGHDQKTGAGVGYNPGDVFPVGDDREAGAGDGYKRGFPVGDEQGAGASLGNGREAGGEFGYGPVAGVTLGYGREADAYVGSGSDQPRAGRFSPQNLSHARTFEKNLTGSGSYRLECSAPALAARQVPQDFVVQCARFGEKGDGILHSALFRGRMVYVPETKSWFVWAGHTWEQTNIHRVEASVEEVGGRFREVGLHYHAQAREAKEAGDPASAKSLSATALQLEKRADILNGSKGVNACIKFTLANSEPLITRPDLWDVDPWLLGVRNGVVDLRTGQLRPGRPEDFMRKACPVTWAGLEARAPVWEKSLAEIIGAAEGVLPYLQRALGYAITGLSSEPLFVMLYGERGRNGKTVIMETLKKALGPYMGPVPAEMLLDRNIPKDPDSASPTIMNLNGMRIVWASETNENRRFSTSQVKLLSGSDSLTGRYLWDRENTEFRPTHTLFLLTNFLPRAPSHDTAFWERLRLVNFPYRFVEQPKGEFDRQRNPKLEQELERELPGILAWLVRGCLLYQREGLLAPAAVLESTSDYRSEEDTMQTFVEMCLEPAPEEARLSASSVYEVYKEWYRKFVSPKTVPSMHVFGRQLGLKVIKRKKGGNTFYFGVRLSEQGEKYLS